MENILANEDKSYLIIEDDPLLLEVYQELLSEFGIKKIIQWDNGTDAQEKINDDAIMGLVDFIIMDLDLPGVPGKELIKQIRSNSDYKRIKILVSSGDRSSKTMEVMFTLGADDYLIKPFTHNVLKRKLESLMLNHFQYQGDIDFLPIRPSTFQLDNEIPFNVFLLQYNRYRLLLREKEIIHPTHIQLMEKFEIKKVYIEDTSEPKYQGYLDQVIDLLLSREAIASEEKAEFLSDFGQNIIKEACLSPNADNIQNLEKVTSKLDQFLQTSGQKAFKQIFKVDKEDTSYRHALKVTAITVLIVNLIIDIQSDPKSKNKNLIKPFEGVFPNGLGDENFKILTDAAMLHDIGHDLENPENLHHSTIAFEKLKELEFINPKVAEIVLHHEEYNNGTGAPSKLNRNQTSLLAKVLSFANFLEKEVFGKQLSPIDAQLVLKEHNDKFMSQLVELLKTVFR